MYAVGSPSMPAINRENSSSVQKSISFRVFGADGPGHPDGILRQIVIPHGKVEGRRHLIVYGPQIGRSIPPFDQHVLPFPDRGRGDVRHALVPEVRQYFRIENILFRGARGRPQPGPGVGHVDVDHGAERHVEAAGPFHRVFPLVLGGVGPAGKPGFFDLFPAPGPVGHPEDAIPFSRFFVFVDRHQVHPPPCVTR